jgi:hypothetical protein
MGNLRVSHLFFFEDVLRFAHSIVHFQCVYYGVSACYKTASARVLQAFYALETPPRTAYPYPYCVMNYVRVHYVCVLIRWCRAS